MPEVAAKISSAVKTIKTRATIERGSRYVLVDEVHGCTGMYRITSNLKTIEGRCFEHFSEAKWAEFLKYGVIKATPRILKGDLELLSLSAEYFKLEEQSDLMDDGACILALPESVLVFEYVWTGKKWEYKGYKFLNQYSIDNGSVE